MAAQIKKQDDHPLEKSHTRIISLLYCELRHLNITLGRFNHVPSRSVCSIVSIVADAGTMHPLLTPDRPHFLVNCNVVLTPS
jgi:hypothetical protein